MVWCVHNCLVASKWIGKLWDIHCDWWPYGVGNHLWITYDAHAGMSCKWWIQIQYGPTNLVEPAPWKRWNTSFLGIILLKQFCHPLPLLQYIPSTKPTVLVHGQRQSPWWISQAPMLLFLHHPPPLPFLLACTMNPSPATALSQAEKQRNDRNLQFQHLHFLPVPSAFTTIGHLNHVSQHCPP